MASYRGRGDSVPSLFYRYIYGYFFIVTVGWVYD
jgi:hypothetical protein